MVFRLLIALLFIVCSSIEVAVFGTDTNDEAKWRVENITPEMLARTLPPEDNSSSTDVDDVDQENTAARPSDSASVEVKKTSDPTLQQLIQTLENDSDRKGLVAALKALDKSNVVTSQQFVFVDIFLNIKTFIKAVVAEVKTLAQTLIKKDTWSFKFNNPLFKKLKNKDGTHFIYILLVALIAQIGSAIAMRAPVPPFFKGLDKNTSIQNVVRMTISLFVFLLVAHILKIYFVKSKEISAYAEEVIVMLFMVQLGLVLLRLSIVTGVLPVRPEYRTSLFSTLVTMVCLWGGYTYASYFISPNVQAVQVSQPLSQVFWGIMTVFGLWIIHHYRHLIDGMVFRELPFAKNRLLADLHQMIAGGVHYVVMISLVLAFLAWFTHNQSMYGYLRDQLLITLALLCGLSLVTSLMVSSAGYLTASSDEDYLTLSPDQRIRMLTVTHRLIDILAFITIGYILYCWVAPLLEMQGVSTTKFSDKLFGIFLVISLAILAFHGLNRIFNSSLPAIKDNKHLKTFLPIMDRLTKLIVCVIAILLVLIEFNVNIMPIVASFSVLGLGIGLASKSIIEDFINGLFIIQENDFNIGDAVTINGITGTVENITLRKVHLRDGQGFMNFIPFSSVGAITNRSRDYNAEKVNIPLPAAFHLKRTVRILEDVGQQLLHDPDLKENIIEAPRFVGISEFKPSSNPTAEVNTMMQFEIKTSPGKLTLVAGEFRKLAKLAFEEMERIM